MACRTYTGATLQSDGLGLGQHLHIETRVTTFKGEGSSGAKLDIQESFGACVAHGISSKGLYFMNLPVWDISEHSQGTQFPLKMPCNFSWAFIWEISESDF